MELIGLIFIVFAFWLVFKILGAIFYAGAFLITIPLKIIGFLLLFIVLIPMIGLVGILIPLLPFILIGMGIIYLLRRA